MKNRLLAIAVLFFSFTVFPSSNANATYFQKCYIFSDNMMKEGSIILSESLSSDFAFTKTSFIWTFQPECHPGPYTLSSNNLSKKSGARLCHRNQHNKRHPIPCVEGKLNSSITPEIFSFNFLIPSNFPIGSANYLVYYNSRLKLFSNLKLQIKKTVTPIKKYKTILIPFTSEVNSDIRTGAICRNGKISTATQSNTCSSNGGVAKWLTLPSQKITVNKKFSCLINDNTNKHQYPKNCKLIQ